ncbi:MAG: hypothetical protein LBQ48_04590 [Oscillospiraceae bacterium]|jgi:cell division septum initiation protein DivIVA|nr:hypothetical protein [Oscillospiraceae bacterium]
MNSEFDKQSQSETGCTADSLRVQNMTLAEQNRQLTEYLTACRNRIEELSARLRRCEEERGAEKHRVGDAIIQAELTRAEIVERARKEAETLTFDARAEAARVTGAANAEAEHIRRKLDTELAAARENLKNLEEATRHCLNGYSTFAKDIYGNLRAISDILSERQPEPHAGSRDETTQSEPPQKPLSPKHCAEDDGFLDQMSELLKNIKPSGFTDSGYPEEGHRIFGE